MKPKNYGIIPIVRVQMVFCPLRGGFIIPPALLVVADFIGIFPKCFVHISFADDLHHKNVSNASRSIIHLDRIRIDCVRNKPQSYPLVGQARFVSRVLYISKYLF